MQKDRPLSLIRYDHAGMQAYMATVFWINSTSRHVRMPT